MDTPRNNEVWFQSETRHNCWLFILPAIAVPLTLLPTLENPAPLLIPFFFFGFLGYSMFRFGQKEQARLDAAREGDYLFLWTFNEQESSSFRKKRKSRYRWRTFWFVCFPVLVLAAIAIVVLTQRYLAGVSASHVFGKIGRDIGVILAVLFSIMFGLRWYCLLPGRRMLKQREIIALFTDQFIRVGDVKFDTGDWGRSRELMIDESDGKKVLKIIATRFLRSRAGLQVDKAEFEIPIPADEMKNIPVIINLYNRNAGHGLHKSNWGWYGRRVRPGEDLGNVV